MSAGLPQPTPAAVSDSTRAPGARSDAAALQRALLECADFAIITTDLTGLIRSFNHAAELLLGYGAEEVIGRVTPAIFHDPAEIARRAASLSAELDRPVPAGFEVFVAKARLGLADEQEWACLTKDRSRVPVRISVTPIRDDAGDISGFLGLAHDITRQRTAQARVGQLMADLDRRVKERTVALQASQQRYQILASVALVGIYHTTADGECIYVNEHWCRMSGISAAEAQGEGWVRAVHPEDRAAVFAEWNRAVKDRQIFAMEYRYQRPDGQITWVLGRATAERNAADNIIGYVGTVTDITERKRAEHITGTLAELGRQLGAVTAQRTAAEAILAAVDRLFVFDALLLHLLSEDRRHVFRILTVDTQDGRRVEQTTEVVAAAPSEMFQCVMTVGAQLVLREPNAPPGLPLEAFGDKQRVSASLMFVPVRAEGAVIGVLSVQSYTPRAYGPECLQLLQAVADYAGTGMARVGAHEASDRLSRLLRETQRVARLACFEGNLVTGEDHWSEEAFRQMGYAPGDVAPCLASFLARVHPEDLPAVQRGIDQIGRDGQPYESRYRVRLPDDEVRYIHSAVAAERDARGRTVRIYGAAQDVTRQQQIEAELRQSHAELEQRVAERTGELARANMLLHSEVEERKAHAMERERLIAELQSALAEVKTLSGLLPICGWCKKVRDDSGYWSSVEGYLKKSSGLDITHGICPDCSAKLMIELDSSIPPGSPAT